MANDRDMFISPQVGDEYRAAGMKFRIVRVAGSIVRVIRIDLPEAAQKPIRIDRAKFTRDGRIPVHLSKLSPT